MSLLVFICVDYTSWLEGSFLDLKTKEFEYETAWVSLWRVSNKRNTLLHAGTFSSVLGNLLSRAPKEQNMLNLSDDIYTSSRVHKGRQLCSGLRMNQLGLTNGIYACPRSLETWSTNLPQAGALGQEVLLLSHPRRPPASSPNSSRLLCRSEEHVTPPHPPSAPSGTAAFIPPWHLLPVGRESRDGSGCAGLFCCGLFWQKQGRESSYHVISSWPVRVVIPGPRWELSWGGWKGSNLFLWCISWQGTMSAIWEVKNILPCHFSGQTHGLCEYRGVWKRGVKEISSDQWSIQGSVARNSSRIRYMGAILRV